MRVSNKMLTDRALFNMQRSLSRFLETQTKLSSGRQIIKPSDDPLGTLRDLDYREELSNIEQYSSNIDLALNWQTSYDDTLAELATIFTDAKVETLAGANDTADAAARLASAGVIASLRTRLLQLANGQLGDRSVFSGYRTDEPALLAGGNGAVYQGDEGEIRYRIESSEDAVVNLNGAAVFLEQLSILGGDADLNVGVTGDTLLGDLNSGAGIDLAIGTFDVTDENLGITVTVDLTGLTAANTVNDAIAAINAQLAGAPTPITDLVVNLGYVGNNLEWDTTASGLISTNTSLSVLNDGHGIDLETASFVITDGAAINIDVDLAGATTIDDVITAFNAVAPANVIMQVDPVGNRGLQIIDTNGPPDLGLSIVESSGGSTASDLGIEGFVGASMTGTDLNPVVSFTVAETTGTLAGDLGLIGSFNTDFSGSDLDPQINAAINHLADLNNGAGIDRGSIVMWQGDQSRSLDLSDPGIITIQDMIDAFNNCGLDITASVNAGARGIQVVNNDAYRSFTIEDSASGSVITRGLGIYGSSDMVGSLAVLENALRENDREGIELLQANMDASSQHLLNIRGEVGSKAIGLESTRSRLSKQELTFMELLSEVEDADLTQLTMDLSTQENAYQASLMASARVIQPTLMDFLK